MEPGPTLCIDLVDLSNRLSCKRRNDGYVLGCIALISEEKITG